MENEKKIKKVYFTLTGTKYHYGMDFLEKGMKLYLEKEPDNKYDKEAIIQTPTFKFINNNIDYAYFDEDFWFLLQDNNDKIGKKATAKVVMLTNAGVICKICKKSLLEYQQQNKEIEKSEEPVKQN